MLLSDSQSWKRGATQLPPMGLQVKEGHHCPHQVRTRREKKTPPALVFCLLISRWLSPDENQRQESWAGIQALGKQSWAEKDEVYNEKRK